MMRTTHMVGPASAWAFGSLAAGAPILAVAVSIPIAAYGGLIPDIDSHASTITRSFWPLSYLTRALFLLVVAIMGTHRRGAHSLIMGVPIFVAVHTPLAFWAGQPWLLLPLLVGVVSHPLLDFWTGDPRRQETAGCCLFWPLSRRRWGVAVMRTNQVVRIGRWKLKLEPLVVQPALVVLPAATTLLWRFG